MKPLTITEMRKLNPRWFNRKTMDHWGTKVEVGPNTSNIFITSERNFDDTEKLYTVRWFNTKTNKVETLGDFQEHKTCAAALDARKKFTASKKEFGINY